MLDAKLHGLRARLAPFRRRAVATALVHLALSLTVHGACFYGALALGSTPLRFVAGVVAGIFSGNLFMIGHDACHGSYTHRRRLNAIVGRLAFLPSYHPYSLWELSHNRIHHVYTNLKGRDFVWTPLSKAEYDALSFVRKVLYRIYRTPLGLALHYPIELAWPRLWFPREHVLDRPRRAYTLDRLLVAGYGVLQVTVAALVVRAGDALLAAAFGFVVPWLVFNWMIGFVIFFNHTHPDIAWFETADEWRPFTATVYGATRVEFPRATRAFASRIMNHVAHHVDPRVPLVRLRAAQERIEELVPGVVVQPWSVADLHGILRRCKLYDYRARRWTDYDGVPTTAPLLTGSRDTPPGRLQPTG